MNNDELERYLNSLILCQEYYYYEVVYLILLRFNDDIESHFKSKFEINKSFRYYQKYYCPNGYSCDFTLIKNHLTRYAFETYTYYTGMTKHTYSCEEAINYFITNFKKVLNEYLKSNNQDFINLSFISTDSMLADGLGSILIHTPTETFLLRAYDMEGCHR